LFVRKNLVVQLSSRFLKRTKELGQLNYSVVLKQPGRRVAKKLGKRKTRREGRR